MSAYSIMGERIVQLNEVTQHGNIEAFYSLIIREDVRILEDIDEVPFVDTPLRRCVDTPLHISASAGHFLFSLEMMILKPSFVNKRNLDGYTPIYLALLNGHTEMVRQLLQHNTDLVHVKGRECMNPLHYAATTNDHLALLENFLSVCPDSITDVTTQNETTLHIALKYDNLEAFKFLVGWLLRKWPYRTKILEQKYVEGNFVLHIAVYRNQTQAVRHLLAWRWTFLYINEKNLEGKTALDILEGQQTQVADISEIRVILEHAGALTASSLPTVTSSYAHYLRLPLTWERALVLIDSGAIQITDEKRNALLVVAVLLVTVTYQAALSPPSPAGGLLNESNSNITAPHRAGSAIFRTKDVFNNFFLFNTLIFVLSNLVIVVLVPPVEIIGFVLVAVCGMLNSSYLLSFLLMVPNLEWPLNIAVLSLLCIIPMIVMATAFILFPFESYAEEDYIKKRRMSRAWSFKHLDCECQLLYFC